MGLELHIWGPAFSLPSIDPECLAAVAYCTHAVPRGEWMLVASGDPSMSPTKELPALHDETRWIGGYGNIVNYLRERSNGQWDLDRALSSQQRADCTAFSTFLRAQLFPLLALSLYVSSTNYPLTRAAYSPILQWPTQYLIPPSLRSAAKAQTSHLGLSSLDLDAATSDNDNSNKAPGEDQIPKSLRIAKKSVTTALKQSEHAARFKLDALMEAAFDPLQQLLGTKRSFLSTDDEEKVSSLDCLALGYLSLALIPALPQSWLSDTMKAKHPPLCQWVWESLQAIGGADVRLEDAFVAAPSRDTEAEGKALPWQVPNPRPLTSAAAVLLTHTLASLPGLSGPTILPPPPSPSPTHNPNPKSSHDPNFPSTSTSTPTLPLLSPLLSLGAVAMALGASLAYAGLFAASPSSDAKRNLSDMGEAGAMLAMASFREDVREVQLERRLDRAAKDKADLVEVDVAVADRRGREVLPIS